jgi:hypothetical protein
MKKTSTVRVNGLAVDYASPKKPASGALSWRWFFFFWLFCHRCSSSHFSCNRVNQDLY